MMEKKMFSNSHCANFRQQVIWQTKKNFYLFDMLLDTDPNQLTKTNIIMSFMWYSSFIFHMQ